VSDPDLNVPELILVEINNLILGVAEIYKDIDSSLSEKEIASAEEIIFNYRDKAKHNLINIFKNALIQISEPTSLPVLDKVDTLSAVSPSQIKVSSNFEGPITPLPRDISEGDDNIKSIISNNNNFGSLLSGIEDEFLDEKEMHKAIDKKPKAPPPPKLPKDAMTRVHRIQDLIIPFADDPSPVFKKLMCAILSETSALIDWDSKEEKVRYESNVTLWDVLNAITTKLRHLQKYLASNKDPKLIDIKSSIDDLLITILEPFEENLGKKLQPPQEDSLNG
jgi:hypothetical protein